MISKADLIKWLNGCIFKGKGTEGVRMWAARHIDADERSQAVEEWMYKPGQDVADLAEEIVHSLEKDAIGLESVEKYVVEAYFGTSKTRGRRFTATIDGGARERDNDGGFHSEPAGARGDAMQGRRHLENMHRLSVGGSNETLRVLRAENEQLRKQVTDLMDRHFKIVDTYEDLRDKQFERDVKRIELDNEVKLKQALLGQVTPLIPAFAMKMLGQGDTPTGGVSAPEQMLFREIAQHVIKNQDTVIPALMAAFGSNPGLMSGIKDLVDKYGVQEEEPPKQG